MWRLCFLPLQFSQKKNSRKMRNSVTAKCLGSTRDFPRFRIPTFPDSHLGCHNTTTVEYNRHSRKFTTEEKCPAKNTKPQISDFQLFHTSYVSALCRQTGRQHFWKRDDRRKACSNVSNIQQKNLQTSALSAPLEQLKHLFYRAKYFS